MVFLRGGNIPDERSSVGIPFAETDEGTAHTVFERPYHPAEGLTSFGGSVWKGDGYQPGHSLLTVTAEHSDLAGVEGEDAG